MEIEVPGELPIEVARLLVMSQGFPYFDWQQVFARLDDGIDSDLANSVWGELERTWLHHLRAALGSNFRLDESENAFLLSSLDRNLAAATLKFMERTLGRVVKSLDGIAEVSPAGKDILIVFDNSDDYYRYVSHYYPDSGEFAFSSGMHINEGCSHYVTVKGDLHLIEPVIAHEMTHGCLMHLSIPLWLNEGLAVTVEHRLTGHQPMEFTAREMRQKHLEFWGKEEIQQFWSGASFGRTDDGNLLSYDLSRILVEHLASDWPRFREFVISADVADGGNAAALNHLDVELGQLVTAFLEIAHDPDYAPFAAV
jgi:hypothetical protein